MFVAVEFDTAGLLIILDVVAVSKGVWDVVEIPLLALVVRDVVLVVTGMFVLFDGCVAVVVDDLTALQLHPVITNKIRKINEAGKAIFTTFFTIFILTSPLKISFSPDCIVLASKLTRS